MKSKKTPRKAYLLILVLLPICGFTNSCNSFPSNTNLSSKSDLFTCYEYIYNDVKFSYIPLSLESLTELHATESRYFTQSASLFRNKKPCVILFNTHVPEEKKVTILYEDALLEDEAGSSYSSQTREDYYDLWEDKIAVANRSKINWLFEHNIHKKVQIVPSNSQIEGYFIFLINGLRQGDFTLTVPVVINNISGNLTFPITLDIDRYEPVNNPIPVSPGFTPQKD
jgi:hypothetical protein